MRKSCVAVVALMTGFGLLIPLGAAAQIRQRDNTTGPRRVDLSVAAGGLVSSDWSDTVVLGSLSSTGIVEQVLVRDLGVVPASALNAAATYWRGRYGVRFHGARSRSCVSIGTSCDQRLGAGNSLGADPASIDVETWLYEVNGMIGLREYTPGQWVSPYALFGIGGVTYDLDRPLTPSLRTIVREDGAGKAPVLVASGTEFLLALEEVQLASSLAFSLGIGTDLRIPLGNGGFGIRIEAADHVARSPLKLRVTELNRNRFSAGAATDRGVSFGAVHNLRFTAGLVVHFGI